MVKSEGFVVQTYYRSSSGALKFKPGYLTDKAGSVLEFEFDASFESAFTRPEALITYTKSYDGWGIAKVGGEWSGLPGQLCLIRTASDTALLTLTHSHSPLGHPSLRPSHAPALSLSPSSLARPLTRPSSLRSTA